MKISFICDTLKIGGPQRVMTALANEFVKKGYNVDIYTVKDSQCDYKLDSRVEHIYETDFSNKKILRLFQKFLWYKKFLNNNKSDCIISFYYTVNMNLMLWKLFGKKNTIIISERNDPNNEPGNALLRKIRNVLYRYADGIVYQTEAARDYYTQCKHIPYAVIANPMREDLPQKFNGKRRRAIVNFCRISKQKNLKLLIDGFLCIQKEYKDIILEIYGDGPLKTELENYTKELHLEEKVHFYPSTPNVHDQIKDALMFVSTSNYEGISNSMMEALGIGLPAVCTDCPIGGAKLMIRNGYNGILIPVNDKEKLVSAIKFLIDNPENADCIGNNAYIKSKEINIKNIADQWGNFIENVVEDN